MERISEDLLLQIRDKISDIICDAKAILKSHEDALYELKAGRFIYVAVYESLWADYGEQTVTYRGKFDEDLNDVILRAEEEFKSINKRSDVQANRKYFVEVWNGVRIEITHKCQ